MSVNSFLSDLFLNFAQFLARKKLIYKIISVFSGISFSIYNHKINKTNNGNQMSSLQISFFLFGFQTKCLTSPNKQVPTLLLKTQLSLYKITPDKKCVT